MSRILCGVPRLFFVVDLVMVGGLPGGCLFQRIAEATIGLMADWKRNGGP